MSFSLRWFEAVEFEACRVVVMSFFPCFIRGVVSVGL